MQTLTQTQDQLHKQASPSLVRLNAVPSRPDYHTQPILQLRRTLGNQALQRMLQTNAQELDEGSSRPADRRLTHDVGREPMVARAPVNIQHELAMNAPGDRHEQEADRVAEQVMRKLTHVVQQGISSPNTRNKLEITNSNDAAEHEANWAAESIVHGQPAMAMSDSAVQVARQTDESTEVLESPSATPAEADVGAKVDGGASACPVQDKGTLSEVSWGETSGLYPTMDNKYAPDRWDAAKTCELLRARGAVHAVGQRGQLVHKAKPSTTDPIERKLRKYHLIENFSALDVEITDEAVKWFYLSPNADKPVSHPSVSGSERVKSYGSFYNAGGGDVKRGDVYIHFYRVKPKPPKPKAQLEGATREVEGASRPGPSDFLLGLKNELNRAGKTPVWSLLDGKSLTLTPPLPLPQLLPSVPAQEGREPLNMAFGPLTSGEALSALPFVQPKPDWFAEMLRTRETIESDLDLWIIYENDGNGMFPNFGSGSDQGRTAALYLLATFNKHGTGLSKVGLTGIEMVTPRGTLSSGAPKGPESTYETPPGPYSGIMAVDIGVTVSRSGSSKVDFIASAGVDSREWGKLVQDTIHEKVSHSPLFPWPRGTKPMLEAGVTWNHTIHDLTSDEFAGLKYTGRLELDAKAITGTRRTEGTLGARFVVRTAQVYTPIGAVSAEFSPIGALVRGFVRYNDGRPATLLGVEGGVNSSLIVNIGRVGVGLLGEAIMSTDPAFQTIKKAGSGPIALGAGVVSSVPAGHHGTGQLILRFGF